MYSNIYIGFSLSPSKPYISIADYASKVFTFVWSPVAPDCPAIHYNILASNCGSCPTTTNHTNVTCTDVPTDGSTCTFAVQMEACGNITGNISDAMNVTTITLPTTTLGKNTGKD